MLSERPPEIVAPPHASPERAAKMKRIVLAAIGGCLVIVLVAGWRLWQHRRAKAMEQTMAMVASPAPGKPASEVARPPSPESANVAAPDPAANAAASGPASTTSATAPSGTAPSVHHAPARTVKSHAAPRKPSSAKRK